VVGSPTVILKLGGLAACSRGILNCLGAVWDPVVCVPNLAVEDSLISDLISENVVAGARGVGEPSFAGGGGGGGAIISEVEGAPRGPRGSDSRSRDSRRETTDFARREPVGRRREEIWDVIGGGRREGVEADMEDGDLAVGICFGGEEDTVVVVLIEDETPNGPVDEAVHTDTY
jgi:hypothetical protein